MWGHPDQDEGPASFAEKREAQWADPTPHASNTQSSNDGHELTQGITPMTEAVIVAALRTPIGRARKGSLVAKDAFCPLAARLGGPASPPTEIDDLVIAESLQGGGVIARHTAVVLGLKGVPGLATNRHCAAGLGPSRSPRDRSRPAWIASSSRAEPRA